MHQVRINLASIGRTGCEKTGLVAAIELLTSEGISHTLAFPVALVDTLIAAGADVGLKAAKARAQKDGVPPDGAEQVSPVVATFAEASYGLDGDPLLVLFFGAATVSARLTPDLANRLATQLARAAAQGPTNRQ